MSNIKQAKAFSSEVKSAKWIGTLNNPDTTVVQEYLKAWHESGARYVCGQLEKGE